jgi:membrane protease YdiL (CAAX protease family)
VRKLEQRIKALSPGAEFAIVVVGAFAPPIVISLWWTIATSFAAAPAPTGEDLKLLFLEEAVILAVLGWFLHLRGWRLGGFDARPRLREVVDAIGLVLLCYLAWYLLWQAIALLAAPASSASPVVDPAARVDWALILAVSILNPLYEELFLCGYIITVLNRWRGIYWASAASLAIRLAFHTYQGPEGLLSIVPVGLVLTLYFVVTRRLWPVIIAHGVLDVVGLAWDSL